jgi:hypothetical protein
MAREGLTRRIGTRSAGRRTPAVLAAAAVLGMAVALGSANAQAPPPPGASEAEVLQYIDQLESRRPPEPDPILPEAPTAEEQLDIDSTADDELPVAPAPPPPPEPPDPPEAPTTEAPAPVESAPVPLAVEPSPAAEAVPPAVEPVAPVEAPPAAAPITVAPEPTTVEAQPVLPVVEAPAIQAPRSGERAHSPLPGDPPARYESELGVGGPVVEAAPVEAPADPVGVPAADAVAAAPPAAETVPVVQAETPARDASAPRSGRVHVVQAGESLWSIAAELLGPGASTDEIARAVERLWQLNAGRIGSGDPDLIVAGERLVLPAGLRA